MNSRREGWLPLVGLWQEPWYKGVERGDVFKCWPSTNFSPYLIIERHGWLYQNGWIFPKILMQILDLCIVLFDHGSGKKFAIWISKNERGSFSENYPFWYRQLFQRKKRRKYLGAVLALPRLPGSSFPVTTSLRTIWNITMVDVDVCDLLLDQLID